MKENVAEYLKFRFEKLKPLKISERGEVWLASNKQSGELVIIKRVAATNLPYDLIKNFSFTLPAKVFFCAEDDSETVVVEEFIQGENLSERKKFLSESQAREILLQMCDGLKELHAQKIIHRDIKPSNLILQAGRIRLIDFDAARIFKAGKETDTKLLGTKGYAPPEQYGSGQTDPRSDIYSLGVTIKNLLGDNCGGRLKKILDKCTELDPKNRFQNVDELKSALTIEEPCRKNFSAILICLTTGIFLLASASTLNSNENFSEEIIPQVEDLPAEKISEPEKIYQPAKAEPFKFPEITLPPQNNSPPPSYEPPKKKYEPPPIKTFSGLLKTEFYLNGALYNQSEHKNDKEKISRDDWLKAQARLHIINDTGKIWNEPKIKIRFGQNWGGTPLESVKSLPPLNIGESADFIILFDVYELSNKKPLSASLQIWLEGDESKMDEHYWCVWFDIVD
ncbi:MAG: serine/threonine protein kinase [Selenomonadaceae bacterium]|nr:serine/threonine protein kinase [Selenomonadaceae bacterium]